jgi:SsrA-binding protein
MHLCMWFLLDEEATCRGCLYIRCSFDKIIGRVGGRDMPKGEGKLVAQNKKANHDYFIEETYEAGIVLQGTEIKAIRAGRVNLKESYARIINGEVFLLGMHISPYEQGNRYNHDPLRTRKLLLHRKQINKLIGDTKEAGYALVPLKLYFKNGYAKVLIGLGKGKKNYDKRETLKRKEANRSIERALRERQKM